MAVNCAIVFYTSTSLPEILVGYRSSLLYQFMLIVMIEHVIIVFKYFLGAMIKDKPSWVVEEERAMAEKVDTVRLSLEMKRDQVKSRGEVPLDEIIDLMKIAQHQS